MYYVVLLLFNKRIKRFIFLSKYLKLLFYKVNLNLTEYTIIDISIIIPKYKGFFYDF